MRRALLACAVLVAAVGLGAPPASAGYPAGCGIVFNPPIVQIGETVHILGSGFFPPGASFDFFINGIPLGTASSDPTDPDGNLDVIFALPAEFQADGEVVISVRCPGGETASNILIVGTGVPTTLPPLGASQTTFDLARIGVGLVLVGGLVLFLSRRKAEREVEAAAV